MYFCNKMLTVIYFISVTDPFEYISFYGLRTHSELGGNLVKWNTFFSLCLLFTNL